MLHLNLQSSYLSANARLRVVRHRKPLDRGMKNTEVIRTVILGLTNPKMVKAVVTLSRILPDLLEHFMIFLKLRHFLSRKD